MIKFTNHVRQRLQERNIKIADIRLAVSNPDYKKYAFDDKIIARKAIKNRILEVIYAEKGKIILVITAYYL